MGLNNLNSQRKKYHFIKESTCPQCLAKSKNVKHFLLECPVYAAQRTEMITNLSHLVLRVRHLQGNVGGRNKIHLLEILIKRTGSDKTDLGIFSIVTKFIKDTQRFS